MIVQKGGGGRGTKELKQLKHIAITEKKEKQYVRQIICVYQGHFRIKLPLILIMLHSVSHKMCLGGEHFDKNHQELHGN